MQQTYPPLVKAAFIELAMTNLYSRVTSIMNRKLDTIIKRNSNLFGNAQTAFIHKNEIYSIEPITSAYKNLNRLHTDCLVDMTEYLNDWKFLFDYEQPMIKGILIKTVNNFHNIIDFKHILPHQIHPVIDEVFSGHKEESYILDPNIVEFITKNSTNIKLIDCKIASDILL